MLKSKNGFTLFKFLVGLLVVCVIVFLIPYFVKKVKNSESKVEYESAIAIKERAYAYYVNNMTLDSDIFNCDFEIDGCKIIEYVSTTKPKEGKLYVESGVSFARLVYDHGTYYICNNIVSNNHNCLNNKNMRMILDSLKEYHETNKKNKGYEGLSCDINNCEELDLYMFFPYEGNINITKDGIINAELSSNGINGYICDSKLSINKCDTLGE